MHGLGKYWPWCVVAGLALWWFFTGGTPVTLARTFVGRGRRLTRSSKDAGGNLLESPEDLQGQIEATIGRAVDLEAVLLARVSASENAGASEREKIAIQWVTRNQAARDFGGDVRRMLTATASPAKAGTLGVQGVTLPEGGQKSVRRCSTAGGGLAGAREIHEDDLFVGESIVAGEIGDITNGSTNFIHYTGYARFRDFLAAKPRVRKWVENGLQPVDLGGVGVLVVFLPAGAPLPEGARYA